MVDAIAPLKVNSTPRRRPWAKPPPPAFSSATGNEAAQGQKGFPRFLLSPAPVLSHERWHREAHSLSLSPTDLGRIIALG